MSLRFSIIPVTAYQQNCTVLICNTTNKAAIVDPGGDLDLIIDTLEAEQAVAEKILITHAHLDHIGGVAELADRLSLPIEGPHQGDHFWIEAIPAQIERFGFPPCDGFTPNRWLNEGDVIDIGEQQLQVLHCAGHTPGHLVFYHQDSQLALVGDVLFKGSIGRTDLPQGDFKTLINSIKTKLWPLGAEVKFISGHGEMSTFGAEMQTNPFFI